MTDIILLRKSEQFDEKDFNAFMRVVRKQKEWVRQERGLLGTKPQREISSEN